MQITSSDVSNFLIELSGLLKELQCNYQILIGDANINNRMQTIDSRYILLEFLITELMTQKMFLVKQKPKDKGSVITINESPTAAALKDIAICLNLGKPPDNISADGLFQKINVRLEDALKSIPDAEKRLGLPLFNPKGSTNGEQWEKIEEIHDALEHEYNLRRKMLMTRLDVTVQSFKWSDRIKGKEKEINEKYGNKQQLLDKLVKGEHRTDIVALLAARDKLAIIEKTSSANVRKNTHSKLQRHIIGKVPDRGGRTLEGNFYYFLTYLKFISTVLINQDKNHQLRCLVGKKDKLEVIIVAVAVAVLVAVVEISIKIVAEIEEVITSNNNNNRAIHSSNISKKLLTILQINNTLEMIIIKTTINSKDTIRVDIKIIQEEEEDEFKADGINEVSPMIVTIIAVEEDVVKK